MNAEILIPILSISGSLFAVIVALVSLRAQRRAAHAEFVAQAHAEAYNQLRWALDLALSPDSTMARVGIEQLSALAGSSSLTNNERELVMSALRTVVSKPTREIEGHQGTSLHVQQEDHPEQDSR